MIEVDLGKVPFIALIAVAQDVVELLPAPLKLQRFAKILEPFTDELICGG